MFGNKIKELRIQRELTQGALSEIVGVSSSTIGMYEQNRREPDFTILSKLATFFNVSIDYLLGQEDAPQATKRKGILIPVLGRVAAGIPIDAVEDILDYEEISLDMAGQGEHFALQIQGDSMEPKISDGDVVIVRQQPTVESGETAIVYVNGCEATCKKILKKENGIMLVATNASVFEPQFYSNQEVQELPVVILGKVIELRAKF